MLCRCSRCWLRPCSLGKYWRSHPNPSPCSPVGVKVHRDGSAHAENGSRGAQGQVGAAIQGRHCASHRRNKVHDQHAALAAVRKAGRWQAAQQG